MMCLNPMAPTKKFSDEGGVGIKKGRSGEQSRMEVVGKRQDVKG